MDWSGGRDGRGPRTSRESLWGSWPGSSDTKERRWVGGPGSSRTLSPAWPRAQRQQTAGRPEQAALDVPPEDGARAEPGPPGLRRPLVADGATGPGVGLAALGPRAAHAQTLPPACSPGSLGSGPSRHGEPSAGSGQGERVTKAHVRVTWGGARGRAPAQVWPGVRAAEGANQGRTAGREAAPGRGGAGLPAVGFLGGVTGRHGGL